MLGLGIGLGLGLRLGLGLGLELEILGGGETYLTHTCMQSRVVRHAV